MLIEFKTIKNSLATLRWWRGGWLLSFSHQFGVPFIVWVRFVVKFTITSQRPRFHHFITSMEKSVIIFCSHHLMLKPTEFSATTLLSALLRLATTPSAYWCSFSASTHNACNVVRGQNVLLRHSVKHYEALIFNVLNIIYDVLYSAAKVHIFSENKNKLNKKL